MQLNRINDENFNKLYDKEKTGWISCIIECSDEYTANIYADNIRNSLTLGFFKELDTCVNSFMPFLIKSVKVDVINNLNDKYGVKIISEYIDPDAIGFLKILCKCCITKTHFDVFRKTEKRTKISFNTMTNCMPEKNDFYF
jgi:hypothetical protein